jgi:hypothetical protein
MPPQRSQTETVQASEGPSSLPTLNPESVEFIQQHPVTCAIFERCGELTREARKMPTSSLERKQLERRYQKLFGYVDRRLYASSPAEQEDFLRTFETSLIEGQICWRGRLCNWDDRKEIMSDLAKQITKRPVGNQVEYRDKVTQALEMKHLNPDQTWQSIAEELKLEIPLEDLKRQVNILKKLLRREEIALVRNLPSA